MAKWMRKHYNDITMTRFDKCFSSKGCLLFTICQQWDFFSFHSTIASSYRRDRLAFHSMTGIMHENRSVHQRRASQRALHIQNPVDICAGCSLKRKIPSQPLCMLRAYQPDGLLVLYRSRISSTDFHHVIHLLLLQILDEFPSAKSIFCCWPF